MIEESILRNDKIEFKNGTLTSDSAELVKYHLITEKQYFRFKFPNRGSLHGDFYFLLKGYYTYKTPKSLVLLNFKYHVFINELYMFLERLYYLLSHRLFKKQVKLKYRINVFK